MIKINISHYAKYAFPFVYATSPALIIAGVSLEVVVLICLVSIFPLMFLREMRLSKANSELFFLAIALLFVDKVNDLWGGSTYFPLFALIFGVVASYGLLLLRENSIDVNVSIALAVCVSLVILVVSNFELLFQTKYKFGRGLSSYVLCLFSYFWGIGSVWAIYFLAFMALISGVLGARSGLLAIMGYCAMSYLLQSRVINIRLAVIAAIFLPMLIIPIGVYYEAIFSEAVTNLFTGRGIIWYELLSSLNDDIYFGVANVVDDKFSYVQYPAISEALRQKEAHNGFVYYIYNSGFVGLVVLLSIMYNSTKNYFDAKMVPLLFGCTIIYSLEGGALFGFSTSGIFLLMLIFAQGPCVKRMSS